MCKERWFHLSPSNLYIFYLFFLPIALARTSSRTLNVSGQSENPFLAPDLMGMHCIFPIMDDSGCGFFVVGLYHVEEVPFNSYSVECS